MCSVCYHELEWALSIQLLQTTVAELQANKKELIAAVVCMLTTVGLNLLEVSWQRYQIADADSCAPKYHCVMAVLVMLEKQQ
jgi:uncharacterized membrane protein